MGAVLLDLDRTLVDLQSFTDYDAAWVEVAGLLPLGHFGTGPETNWSSATRACMGAIATLPGGGPWKLVSSTIERHERTAVPQSQPMPEVRSFLNALVHRPLAVVTLLPESVARETLAFHGLQVDVVVGRDPLIRPKPSGDGLLAALAQLGESAFGSVMVGDSTWDAGAAADAGVSFIGVHAPPSEFTGSPSNVPVCASLAEVLGVIREFDAEAVDS